MAKRRKNKVAAITMYLMLAALVGLIVWDVVVATNKDRGDTISEITLAASVQQPHSGFIVGLAFGILVGHLWWPQVIKPPTERTTTQPINAGEK
jgi:hypothetical protein